MIQQQILRLQIAIDNVHRVHVFEREDDATGVELGGGLIERGALAEERELKRQRDGDEGGWIERDDMV